MPAFGPLGKDLPTGTLKKLAVYVHQWEVKPVTEIGRCRQDRFFGTGIISNERTGTG
jgi:hypothetical protein